MENGRITKIEIENIKGIDNKKFDLDIIPNKPSILVAPNGFGKSSLAKAFQSMNNKRIVLREGDYYKNDSKNLPRIRIEYQRPDKSNVNLEATNISNTISKEIAYFVINNLLKPKSGYETARARLEIEDVVLINKIPQEIQFDFFSVSDLKNKFGLNGRILPNIENIFERSTFVKQISRHYQDLQRATRQRIQKKIDSIIKDISAQQGTEAIILDWIKVNRLNELRQIKYLNTIGDLINNSDTDLNSIVKSYLVAIQLIWLYNQNQDNFRKACAYNNYLLTKKRFDKILSAFNCTWKNIRSSETHGKLVVKFPEAMQISNGQRDILTFISMLFSAEQNLKKPVNILIIDEIFDYLDDANLIAAQYYITRFIEDFKANGKCIYPLILTHLDPNYFKNYVFKKQKVYYLNQSQIQVNPCLEKLLRNRDSASIKDDIDKYLLHYNPQTINKRAEFRKLGIPELWGEGTYFIKYLNKEMDNYLNGNIYDPFAVCGALRIEIEKIAYDQLQSAVDKEKLIHTHTTSKKLEEAENMGIVSPESHYLLGLIYNEGMHWKKDSDNVSPIVSKLENLVIKNLIRDIFNK
jgi:ABC-type cobalamin/Fe3+-siderophores transport system ATPase subunit